jgi:tRNA-dihydrouridine synthase 3
MLGRFQPIFKSDISQFSHQIHGRSRLQRYSKLANFDYIAQVASSQSPDLPQIPVIGNGDIFSFTDYEEKVLARIDNEEGSGGTNNLIPTAMLGRGALIKPWLPTEIKERRHWDISATERFDILKDFVRFGLEHWGSDQQGVNHTRRFMLEWISFLHRYVPVGILEVMPQKMNQRPPNNMVSVDSRHVYPLCCIVVTSKLLFPVNLFPVWKK